MIKTAGSKKFESPKDWRLLDAADVENWKCSPLIVQVEGIIALGNLVLLAAATQTGKTLLALYIALFLACGGKLFGKFSVTPVKKILYLVLEDPDRRIQSRILDIQSAEPALKLKKGAFQVYVASGLTLTGEWCFAYLEHLIQKKKFAVVFLDTYQKATPGLSSFDDAQQSLILHRLAELTRKHSVTIIVLDHLRKAQGPRRRYTVTIDDIKGTGGKAQNADCVILLQRLGRRQLSFESQSKDWDEPVELTLDVSPQGSGEPKFQVSGSSGSKGSTKTPLQKILSTIKPGEELSSTEVAKRAKVSPATALRYLKKLVAKGDVVATGKGRWTKYSLAKEETD